MDPRVREDDEGGLWGAQSEPGTKLFHVKQLVSFW